MLIDKRSGHSAWPHQTSDLHHQDLLPAICVNREELFTIVAISNFA
jgi:hypothetical protein